MIARFVEAHLRRRLKSNPAVVLVGPRQSGKTTLARSLSSVYFDLEQSADRLRLDLQWDELVSRRQLMILDEAQTLPELFPRLRGAIDADRRRNGRFLLLGSVSPALMQHVAESLAGRLALVELSPFLMVEQPQKRLEDFWLRGGFPDGGILTPKKFPQWQQDYMTLLAQRDLPVWGLPAKPAITLRLLRMLAAVHGQIWNATQVGQSLGLNYHTINSYLGFLEGAFLIRQLPPWLPNLKKRLVRSPKIYLRDSGLLHALLGVRTMDDLLHQPWVGSSWEGFVVHQALGLLAAHGEAADSYYFRTSDGYEMDLIFKLNSRLYAVEAKLSANPSQQDYSRFNIAAELIGADRRYLVAQVAESSVNDMGGVVSLAHLLNLLEEEF